MEAQTEVPVGLITENDPNINAIAYRNQQLMKKEIKKEKTLAEIENDVRKKWEEIKNYPKEDVDIAEKFYNDNSVILYVPTSVQCHGIEEIQRVHSYNNHCGISTKDLSNEVIINTTVCGSTITEEKILTILHSRPIQWLLPGVQATGRRIVLPMVTIVSFDDDLYIKSKRLYWDQACVLKQVGLIPMVSRCPFNGEDIDVPVKGVQQSDPLLTKEQLEDINSLDILNRHTLKRASIERFRDLRSSYVNKNNNDSVKKLFEEDGLGVEEYVQYDGRRRAYDTIDFRNKSDTLSGFVSGDIKEEYTLNDKLTSKNFKRNKNESKNINEILSESNTYVSFNQGTNENSTISSKPRRMFKEYLYKNDNIFPEDNNLSEKASVFSGKRLFTNKNKDSVKISMENSDTESDGADSYSTIYDFDNKSDHKWDLNCQSMSRDETLTEISCENQTDSLSEKMKNLCLNNNYMDDNNSIKQRIPNSNVTNEYNNNDRMDEKKENNNNNNNATQGEKKHKKYRIPKMQPHFISNITFDNYGELKPRDKSRMRKKIIIPKFHSTFKIAYDKEELERDNIRVKKPISPTYISHIFDKDDTVRKVRPIYRNSVYYESICFDDYSTERKEVKPSLVVKDKYVSNIFKSSQEMPPYIYHNKYSSNARNQITYSNIRFDDSAIEENRRVVRTFAGMEDHIHKIFSPPSIDTAIHPVQPDIPKNNMNYSTFNFDDPPEQAVQPSNNCEKKDKFASHLFKENRGGEGEEIPTTKNINENDLSRKSSIYTSFNNDNYETEKYKGIKTQFRRVDHIKDIFNSQNDKLNFRDIRTINNIHNSMHRQPQAQRV